MTILDSTLSIFSSLWPSFCWQCRTNTPDPSGSGFPHFLSSACFSPSGGETTASQDKHFQLRSRWCYVHSHVFSLHWFRAWKPRDKRTAFKKPPSTPLQNWNTGLLSSSPGRCLPAIKDISSEPSQAKHEFRTSVSTPKQLLTTAAGNTLSGTVEDGELLGVTMAPLTKAAKQVQQCVAKLWVF